MWLNLFPHLLLLPLVARSLRPLALAPQQEAALLAALVLLEALVVCLCLAVRAGCLVVGVWAAALEAPPVLVVLASLAASALASQAAAVVVGVVGVSICVMVCGPCHLMRMRTVRALTV